MNRLNKAIDPKKNLKANKKNKQQSTNSIRKGRRKLKRIFCFMDLIASVRNFCLLHDDMRTFSCCAEAGT